MATTVDISWDGTYITVSNGAEQTFLLNSTEDTPKTEMWKTPALSADNTYSAISSLGEHIVQGDANGYVRLFNNSYSSNPQYIWEYDTGPGIYAVDISYDGFYIAAASSDGYVYVFNRTKTASKTYKFSYDTTSAVNFVKISKYGDYVVAGNADNEVYLFNTTDFQGIPMWNFTTTTTLTDLDISSIDPHVIVGENNDYIHLLNKTFSAGNKLAYWSYNYNSHFPQSVAISADDRYIVSGNLRMGTGFDTTLVFNSTKTTPKNYLWKKVVGMDASADSVAISGFGNYFAEGFHDSNNDKLFLFHHDVPLPEVIIILPRDDSDDDDDKTIPTVPFGNYFLLFTAIGIVSLIIITRQKVILKKK